MKIFLYVILGFFVMSLGINAAHAHRKRHFFPCVATPTPEASPTPSPTPLVIVEPPPPELPFRQPFEVVWWFPAEKDAVDTKNTFLLEMSMAVNGDRLSGEAFELKPVIEKDYDTLILGNEIALTPVLYSTEGDGTKARHIRLVPAEEMEHDRQYRLVVKSDEHLVAANAGGSKLLTELWVFFNTN